MKLRTTLMAAVASLALMGAAYAAPVTGQISIGGYAMSANSTGMGAATGIDFASGTAPGGLSITGSGGSLYSFGGGSGSFASLACASLSGGCGTIKNISSFATETATPSFLTLNTSGGPAVSFDLSKISSVANAQDTTGGSVTFTADGTINFTGFDATAGHFILTAQGNHIVSFSATTLAANAVPEPASLLLLGGGLAAIGLVRRRKAA